MIDHEYSSKECVYPVKLMNLSRADNKTEKYYIKQDICNIYNVCYMNSSIQCLFHLKDFIHNILSCKGGKLIDATTNLLKDMLKLKNKGRILSVTKIKEEMGEKFKIYDEDNQEDAKVFIVNYLDILHKEISDKNNTQKIIPKYNEDDKECFIKFYYKFCNKKGSSFIIDLFYGILRTKKYCIDCKILFSKNFSSFNILELPIYDLSINNNSVLDFYDILKSYISPKTICNLTCGKCGKQVVSLTEIYFLPKYLIICFGRYFDEVFIGNSIKFPKIIDFKKFLINEIDNNYIYNLKSIIFYRKIGKNGHYSASCLNNNNWIYFDDQYVGEFDQNSFNEIPIILFYEKENKN